MPGSDIIDNIPTGLDPSTKFIIIGCITAIGVLSSVIIFLFYLYLNARNRELVKVVESKNNELKAKDEMITLLKHNLEKADNENGTERDKNDALNTLINERMTPALFKTSLALEQETNAINLIFKNVKIP